MEALAKQKDIEESTPHDVLKTSRDFGNNDTHLATDRALLDENIEEMEDDLGILEDKHIREKKKKSKCKCWPNKRKLIIMQNDSAKFKWDIVVILGAMFNCATIPIEIAFVPETLNTAVF